MFLLPKEPNLIFGIIVTVIAYFFFSITSSFVKVLTGFPTFEIVFFQNFFSLLIFIPYCWKRRTLNFKKPFASLHLVRDLSGIGGYIAYFFAIKYTHLVEATVLAYTAPFFIPIIWAVWVKEKIEKDVWWAIILGFIGIGCILKPSTNIFQPGALIGILAGILSAFSLVAIRLLNQKQASLSRTLFYFFLLGSILTLPLAVFSWNDPSLLQLLYLIIIGITTALGQICLMIAYRHGTASFLSPLCYSMIIFILLISWLIFNQHPDLLSLIGTFFIVLGGTLTFVIRKKPETIKKFFEHPQQQSQNNEWWKFWKKPPPKN